MTKKILTRECKLTNINRKLKCKVSKESQQLEMYLEEGLDEGRGLREQYDELFLICMLIKEGLMYASAVEEKVIMELRTDVWMRIMENLN